MIKLIEGFDINDTLYIYLQDNSKRWYARFVLFGKWYSKATKQKDKDKVVAMAHRLFLEYEIKIENNTLVQSKAFLLARHYKHITQHYKWSLKVPLSVNG